MRHFISKLVAGLGLALLGTTTYAGGLPADAVAFNLPRAELLREHNRIRIALPGAREIEFATQSESLGRGATGVYGRSASGDRLMVFAAGDYLSGDIYASGGRYRLVGDDAGYGWASYLQPANAGFSEPAYSAAANGPRAPQKSPRVALPSADGSYEVDVLVLYTERYAAYYPTADAAIATIQELVFRANMFFKTSAIPARYRLVSAEFYPTNKTYEVPDFGAEPGVVARRNATGADLVFMLEGGLCRGQAITFNGHTPTLDGETPTNVDAERDAFAYGSLTPDCYSRGFLLAHELGHTMGGGHEQTFSGMQQVPNPVIGDGYWKDYAHGARCGNAGAGGAYKYVSIMAYGLETTSNKVGVDTDVRGDFFSSPDFSLDGEACGAEGTPDVEATRANNVRSITLAAPYVAAYRQPADAKVSTVAEGSRLIGALGLWSVLSLLAAVLARLTCHLPPTNNNTLIA